MKIGMMWFVEDDGKLPLVKQINNAADYYLKKYGKLPTRIEVNPVDYAREPIEKVGDIQIAPDRSIIPKNFFVGESDNGK